MLLGWLGLLMEVYSIFRAECDNFCFKPGVGGCSCHLHVVYGKIGKEVIFTMIGYIRISILANLGDFTNQV